MTDQAAPENRDEQPGGQEVAAVNPAQTALERTPVEGWLAENGVEIQHLPDGRRQLRFHPEVSQRTNPLVPLAFTVQVSRNFTPIPKLVKLNLNEDTYKQGWDGTAREETHAIRATGLRKIADLMGIEHVNTDWGRPPDTDKGIVARVTVRWRGPDGLWSYTTKSKTVRFEQHMEKLKSDAIAKRKAYPAKSGPKAGVTEYTEQELQELVLNEYEHIDAKCETKAWNRCIREVAKVATLPKSSFSKPFLTLSWYFTPDPSDPHALDVIKAQLQQGSDALYGGGEEAAAALGSLAIPTAPALPQGSYVADGEHVDDEEDDPLDDEPEDANVISSEQPDPTALDADDEWDEAPAEEAEPKQAIPEPAESFTFPKGEWEGKTAKEAAESLQGRAYIAQAIKRVRKEENRERLLGWLAWGLQTPVTLEALDAAIAADSEPA